MICNNCKKEVELGTIICPYCGCLTEENSNDSVDTIDEMDSNNKSEYKDSDNNSYKFGIFVSILVLIAGIVFFFYSSFGDIGSTDYNVTYGGDAYTGIQNAASQTVNNVYYLIICISKGIGILTSSIGLISLSYFIQKSKNK